MNDDQDLFEVEPEFESDYEDLSRVISDSVFVERTALFD